MDDTVSCNYVYFYEKQTVACKSFISVLNDPVDILWD
jgi:hypothetical protein